MEKHKKLNLKTLQTITLNRSKLWTSVFEKYDQEIDTEEIPIKKIETLFENDPDPEDEESDSMESEEEENAEEMELLQDLSNTILTCKNKDETVRELLSRTMQSKTQSQNMQEFISIIDSTLSVIEKNRRTLENPANSLNSQDSLMLQQSHANTKLPSLFKNISPISKSKEQESSSDESLHSDDTARYIRSSRKQRSHSKSTNSNSMIIKTYRHVKSKRDALREKYAFSRQDIEDIDYERYFRHQREHKQHYADSLNPMHLHRSKHESHRKKRLPKLHKLSRHYSSSSDISSSEDSPVYPRHRSYSASIRKRYRSASPCTYYKGSCSHSKYLSRHTSRSSCGCFKGRSKYKRESECTCFIDDTLCENYIHVANTSNEDWIVENCTPKSQPIRKRKAYSEQVGRLSKELVRKKDRLTKKMYEIPDDFVRTGKSRSLSLDISGISPFSSTVLSTQNAGPRKIVEDSFKETNVKESNLASDESDGEPKKKTRHLQQLSDTKLKRARLSQIKEEGSSESAEIQDSNRPNKSDEETKKKKTIQMSRKEAVINDEKVLLSENNNKISFENVQPEKKSKRSPTKENLADQPRILRNRKKIELPANDDSIEEIIKKPIKERKSKNKKIKPSQSKSGNKVELSKSFSEELEKAIEESKKTYVEEQKSAKKLNISEKTVKVATTDHIETEDTANKTIKENVSKNKTSSCGYDSAQKGRSSEQTVKVATTDHIDTEDTANKTIKENVSKNKTLSGENKSLIDNNSFNISIKNKSLLNESKSSLHNTSNSSKKILVYKPGVTTDIEVKNGRIQFTCEYLGQKIGDEQSRRFFQFYAGKKDFNPKLHVYFYPPENDNSSYDESGSEDELFCFGKYGYLAEEK